MTRRHTSFRLSEPAIHKLAELAKAYGNKTTVIELAIDRLYQQHHAKERAIQTLRERLDL